MSSDLDLKGGALLALFCGLDLHVNNTYAVVSNDSDDVQLDKRLPNDLELILKALEPFREEMATVAVESTFVNARPIC